MSEFVGKVLNLSRKYVWIALGYKGGFMPATLADIHRAHNEHMKNMEHRIDSLLVQHQNTVERQLATATAQQLEFHAEMEKRQDSVTRRNHRIDLIVRLLPHTNNSIAEAIVLLDRVEKEL